MANDYSDDAYEEVAQRRTKALAASMRQTLAAVKARFKEKHPELTEEELNYVMARAVQECGKKLGGF